MAAKKTSKKSNVSADELKQYLPRYAVDPAIRGERPASFTAWA